MKTLYAIVLLAFVGLAILGCSESTDQLVAPVEKGSTVSLEKGVIHSATGSAQVFDQGKSFTFAFTAREYSDGNYDGQYQIYVHSQPPEFGKIHGKVMSLKVYDWNGGKAAVIGTIETNSGFEGFYDAFVVMDYGEGNNSQTDMYSTTIFWSETLEEAQDVWNLPPDQVIDAIVAQQLSFGNVVTPEQVLIPIQMGNVQVR